jgi:asparagine synthase (glutamine-hydrolysing)
MCGIVGFNQKDEHKIVEINDTLSHRGPDDSGIYTNDQLSMGHKRLSILDLSIAGHQPMFYIPAKGACSDKYQKHLLSDALTGIVFNGEIYNFIELRNELRDIGYVFTTNCDTELVLAAYLEWGNDCVKKFNGMWAFCIYNKKDNLLFLSRDRFGKKPLYYYHKANLFAFASELKPFFKLNIPIIIDADALNHFFIFSHSPSENTIIQQIKKIRAGGRLIFSLKENKIIFEDKYWEPAFIKSGIDFLQAKTDIYGLIDDSVKKRLLSDVEVGAFLSGGLDSSIIAYFMKKHVENFKTFSIKFDYPDYNESIWAKKVAHYFSTDHYEINFNSEDIKKLIDTLPYYYDEPFGDESMIPTFLVSKVAAQYVKVVLSGTGSDEIFGGYNRYREYKILLKLRQQRKLIKKLLVKSYAYVNSDKAGKLNELIFSENDNILYIKLLSDLFRGNDGLNIDINKIYYLDKYFNQKSHLDNLLNFDQNHYLTDDLLIKEDRATMANSIEGRIPFLDYRLAEYVNALPDHYKIADNNGKYILKEIFKNKIPDEVLTRKKQGFGVPLKHYFRKELRKYTESIIFDSGINDYYNIIDVKKMWERHLSEKSDYSSFFWNLVIFNKWLERWMI